MAHEKHHDYHILDPSIWPFIGAVGGFTLLFGAVLFFNDFGPWVMLIGAALVVYTMIAWWTDVIKESGIGDHTPVVQIGLRYGFILFIISEVMFFSAWFWNFFKHAMYPMEEGTGGVWPPAGIETFDPWHLPLINTLILLSSGGSRHLGASRNCPRKQQERFRIWSRYRDRSGHRVHILPSI